MTGRRGRLARRAGLLCAGWMVLGPVAAAFSAHAAPLPLTLSDPLTRSDVEVGSGATALHIVFFATWCPACVAELDALADLQARWEQSGYRLVVVAVKTRQTPERLARFAAERQVPGRLLHDSDGRAQKALGAESLPAHILIDRSGNVVARAGALDDAFLTGVEEFMRRWQQSGERGP